MSVTDIKNQFENFANNGASSVSEFDMGKLSVLPKDYESVIDDVLEKETASHVDYFIQKTIAMMEGLEDKSDDSEQLGG